MVTRPRAASDPTSGSVSANAPIFSSLAIDGSHRSSAPRSRTARCPHSERVVAAEEDRQRRVDAGQLDHEQPVEQLAVPRAAVAGELAAGEVHLRERGHDRGGELARSQWSAMIGATSDSR